VGKISLDSASTLLDILKSYTKIIETEELEKRVKMLEGQAVLRD
jgi:hypothetical protein